MTSIPPVLGLWGYNLGAYAALREAENDHRIGYCAGLGLRRAAADGENRRGAHRPRRISADGSFRGFSFTWLNYKYREDPPLSKKLNTLAGVPKLFIEPSDDPELADITRQMFVKSPEPRDQIIIPHGNFVSMDDADKRDYENRVVSFFLLRLPATGTPSR